MSQYCRITGKSRGLPKPNYFPLLPPISPADANKLCRITGKSIGLPPSHSFIPVPLQPPRKKPTCPVTGKSIGQPQHHFIPGVPKAVPHEPIPGFRYVVPVLDNPPALLQELLKNDALPDTIVAQYVYTLEEKKCGIILPASLEAAVREGTVSDLLLQDTNERFSLRLPEGRQVTVKVVALQPKPPTDAAKEGSSSATTTTDGVTPILDGQGPNNPPPPAPLENLKIPGLKPKKQFTPETPAHKAQTKVTPPVIPKVEEQVVSADATSEKESARNDELAPSAPAVPPLQPVSVEKKASVDAEKPEAKKMQEVPAVNGMQELIADIKEEISKLEVLETEKLDKLRGKETAKTAVKKQEVKIEPVESPKETVIEVKSQEEPKAAPVVASDIKETPVNTEVKIEQKEEIKKPEISKGEIKDEPAVAPPAPPPKKKVIKKKVSSEEKAITAQNDAKLPSQVEATRKSDANEIAEQPKPVRRESSSRALDTSVLKSIWDVARRDEKSEKSGLTLKFVLGKQPNLKDIVALQKNMEKGDVIELVWDQEVLQGKNIEISEGKFCFVPGKIVNGGFMAGQTIDGIFVPGLTVKTPAKISLIPGCVMKEEGFIAGINKELKFVPGQIFKDGVKEVFVPAEQVVTDDGIKYVHREEPPPGAAVQQAKVSVEAEKQKNGNGEVGTNGTSSKKDKAKKEKKMKKVKGMLKDNNSVYGHMIQMEKGVEFYPEGNKLPIDNVLRTIPGQLVKHLEEEEPRFVPGMMMEGKFVAGQMVRTAEGTKFVPGQLVRNKEGAKFVPGQTLEDGQFVPGQVVDNKFVPGQIVQTTAGPTFIPGQVITTPEEGARFVPGRVVETFEGPHFVPGRVIEDQNGAVAFVPGRVVETEDGPRFVAPDLESTPDGTPKFAMQSFEVSPEELQLLEHQGTTNMESGGTIDQQMLEHLAKAGITLSQNCLPDVYVTPKNLQEMATHISSRLKLPEEAKIKISMVLDKVAELGHNIKHGKDGVKEGVVEHERPKLEISSVVQNHAFEIIESAILAAVLTASKDISMNPGEAIVQEMNIVLEEALPSNSLSNSSYTDYLVTALFEVVTSEATLEAITTSVQQGLKKPVANKVEVLKYIANRTENVQDTVEKISSVLRKPKHHPDLGKAFRRLSIGDPDLVDLVVAKVSNKVENVITEKEATNTLQTAIVSAVRENSERQIHEILDNEDQSGLRHLILQAVGLAEALGLKEAADELMYLLEDDRIANALSKDRTALEILQRLTLMKKLAESRPAYAQAMSVLSGEVPKEDTKFLKQLVRESEALLTAVQEEEDSYEDDDDTYSTCSFNSAFDDEIISRVPRRISSSKDIPYSLFHAFVDCQKPLKLLKRILLAAQPDRRFAFDHSCVILKDRNQTVIPKESSRDVLTGRASYTLIDEVGVKNYNALDVFSALKIDKPIALKKFSLYTEGLASTWVHAAELPPEMNDLLIDSTYKPVAYEPVASPVQDSTFEEVNFRKSSKQRLN